MTESFDLVVGTKRQVTIPVDLFRRLALKQGDQLRLTLNGQAISLEPMVSVPRHLVSPALLEEMNARRGAKATDLTLSEFRAARREAEAAPASHKAAPKARAQAPRRVARLGRTAAKAQ